MTLELTLLGRFEARRDGVPVPVASRRGRVLLAALAVNPGRRITRDRAVALLWPDRDEAQGRASLRQELSGLRRAVGADVLCADAEALWLVPGAGVACDVWALTAGGDPVAAFAAWGGPLLDGIDLRIDTVEDWLETERRDLAALATRLGEAAVEALSSGGDASALIQAERLARLDPLNEVALGARMRAAAGAGRVPDALRLYDGHVLRLREDLDSAPGAALTALRDAIAGGGAKPAPDVERAIFQRPPVLLMGFDALSQDEGDRLIALGLAEDLRTTLSHWRWFPVIGPEAVGWKTGRDGDLREIAGAVGAAYAVSGSLRRAGDRVRISANLTEVASGRLIWSQSIDGRMDDIFEMQEAASRSMVAQLEPELLQAEARRIERAPPGSLTVWHLFLQAQENERRAGDGYGTPEANREQARLMQEIIAQEPGQARAWAWLCRCHWREVIMGWAEDREAAISACLDASETAMRLDPQEWDARTYHALALLFGRREGGKARVHAAEAVRLNPSAVIARHAMGCVLENIGCPDEALEHLEAVFRLNPNHGGAAAVLGDIVTCNSLLGRHDAAVEAALRLVAMAPGYSRGLQRAASALALAGQDDVAFDAVRRLFDAQPDFTEDYVRATYPFARPEDLELFVEGLRRAGALG